MDLAEGDELLVLVEEHADEAQGWIFAAKAAEAGYVPRTYLEVAGADAPAKAPTPEVTDSSGGEEILEPVTQPRAESPPHPLVPPLSPIAGSPPETAQSPQPQGALEDYLWAIFQRVDTEREGTVATAEVVQALRDDEGFAGALGFSDDVRGGENDASEFRDDVARALEALDAKRVSWDEFRRAALGDEDGEGDRERQLADENAELKRRLARASGDGLGGGQQWGSMAGGDDDDSYSSRSSRSYSSRSGDSLYDEFEDFQ